MTAEQVELFHVDTPTAPETRPEDLSPDRRRTLRQHQQIADGWHPLTGSRTRPELGTCGTCAHRIRVAAFQHPKCEFGPWSKSAATDVRRWWPACERWEAKR